MDLIRCPWVDLSKKDYVLYHDIEWGVPVHCDKKHFEFLSLELSQAGLSWYTILRKRGGYRRAFFNFDPFKIAKMNKEDISKLYTSNDIVKNRLKIDAIINNAKAFIDIIEHYGTFDRYIWSFVDGKPIVNHFTESDILPAKSRLSEIISKELKRLNFKFIGPIICYSYMQAVGIVNDHTIKCFRREQIIEEYYADYQ